MTQSENGALEKRREFALFFDVTNGLSPAHVCSSAGGPLHPPGG